MFIEKISKQEAIDWIKTVPSAFSIATIFGGDRWSCVDSVFSAKKDNKIVGIVTISNEGENYNNQPSIVGLYVSHKFRNTGLGFKLFKRAVEFMIENGLVPIKVDVLNSKVFKIIDKLPQLYKDLIVTTDFGSGMFDIIMDQ